MGNEKWTSRPLEAENMVSPTQKIMFGLVQMPPYFFPFLPPAKRRGQVMLFLNSSQLAFLSFLFSVGVLELFFWKI